MDTRIIARFAAKACEGDAVAFERLYNMTIRQSYFFVKKSLRDDNVVNEVLNECYTSAFNNLSNLKKPESFESWFNFHLALGVKNRLVALKGVEFDRIEFGGSDDLSLFKLRESSTERRHANSLFSDETRRLVSFVLDGLPYVARVYLLLYYFLRLDEHEISEALSVPEKAVKSNILIATIKVKESLEALSSKFSQALGSNSLSVFLMLLSKNAECMSLPLDTDKQLLEAIRKESGESAISEENDGVSEKSDSDTVQHPTSGKKSVDRKMYIIIIAVAIIITGIIIALLISNRKNDALNDSTSEILSETTTAYSQAAEVYDAQEDTAQDTTAVTQATVAYPTAEGNTFFVHKTTQATIQQTRYTDSVVTTMPSTGASRRQSNDPNDKSISKSPAITANRTAATTAQTTTKKATVTTSQTKATATQATVPSTTATMTATPSTDGGGSFGVVTTTPKAPVTATQTTATTATAVSATPNTDVG